jgi:hypothetical protein
MLADDLLVGNDRWRMTSLAVEPDGSVMKSVVPGAVSAICPMCGARSARRHTWYRRTALDLPWRKFTVRLPHLGAPLLLRRTQLPEEDLCGAIHRTPPVLRPPDGRGDWPPSGVRSTSRR